MAVTGSTSTTRSALAERALDRPAGVETATARLAPPAPPVRPGVAAAGGLVAAALTWATFAQGGTEMGVLMLLGLALGAVLFHARFGFTSAWRQLVAVGQGRALRAQMVMLALGSVIFAVILSQGWTLFGQRLQPAVAPVGVSVVVGSLLFGIGMQLAGSCASGTLYVVGSGQGVTVATVVGFMTGSVLGAWSFPFWTKRTPAGPAISLTASRLGFAGAVVVQLLAFAAIAGVTLLVERRRRPPRVEPAPVAAGWGRLVRGSWPLLAGAAGLAVLNGVVLLVSGQPWGITFGYALWGAQAFRALGYHHIGAWPYWTTHANAVALHHSVLANATSVTDIGIMAGALVASAVAGTFVRWRLPAARVALAAVLGGLLMGYGARIAFGCNIGAYFDGIVSFSLHGWVWGAMALVGTWVGIRLRPLFGLANPRPTDAVC